MSKDFKNESIITSLSTNQRKFIAEVLSTFIIIVLATGSVVIDAKLGGILEIHL